MIYQPVEQAIHALQMRLQEELNQFSSSLSIPPTELYSPIQYTLAAGGKRLRPLLVLLSCDLLDGKAETALPYALGIELFHNFTLIHDDIMDNALLRRNQLPVYRKWNTNTAILAGDVLLVKSFSFFSQRGLSEEISEKIRNAFLQMATQVCEGQQWDLLYQHNQNISVQEYLDMIKLKTAVLFGTSMQIGAWCGGADDKVAQTLFEFGVNIGLAFQLQDDLLDIYGDPHVMGKRRGGDILENKKTFLLVKCRELVSHSPERIKRLDEWLTCQPTTEQEQEEKINGVKSIYDSIGIQQHTEIEIARYRSQAISLLHSPLLSSIHPYKKELFQKFISSVWK